MQSLDFSYISNTHETGGWTIIQDAVKEGKGTQHGCEFSAMEPQGALYLLFYLFPCYFSLLKSGLFVD